MSEKHKKKHTRTNVILLVSCFRDSRNHGYIKMRNPYLNKLPKSHVRWIVVSIYRDFNVIDKVNCDVIKLNSISYNWEFIKRNFAKYNLRYNKEKNVATAYQHGMPLPPG